MTRLQAWQGTVFILLWLAYGATYLLRKPLGIIKGDLEVGFKVKPSNLGWVDTALLLPYALVSITLGSLGDRLGPRITLAGGLVLSAAATVPMASCQSLPPLLVLLTVSGAGQALCWPAACSLLSRWYSDASRNSVFGMFGTCCFLGGLAGTGLAVYMQAEHGWRSVFLPPAIIVACLGVLVSVLGKSPGDLGLVVPNRAADQQAKDGKEGGTSMLKVFRMAMVPEVSVTMFCIKAVRYALMFWLPLYLTRTLGYTQTGAGLASTSFEVGGVVGSACVGMVVDRWMGGRALLTSAFAIVGSAISLLLFMLTSSWGLVFHAVFLAIAGALNCGPDVLLAGSVAADIGEREGGAPSAVASVVNGMGSLGTVLEGPVVAFAAAYFGFSSMVPLMILLMCFGAVATFRANQIHRRTMGRIKLANETTVA